MRRPEDVHHALACGEEVVRDDTPVAAPPDGLGAHDRASVPATSVSEPRQTRGERLRQRIVGIVPKAPHTPVGVRRRFHIPRSSSKAAKFGDVFVADLPRPQRFGEAVGVKLRIGARPRH